MSCYCIAELLLGLISNPNQKTVDDMPTSCCSVFFREKRNAERLGGMEDRSRERELPYHNSDLRHSHSRSRSRSPLVNGRVGSAKSEGSYDKPPVKIKEERKEEDYMERERDKLRNDYLLGSMGVTNPLSATLIERGADARWAVSHGWGENSRSSGHVELYREKCCGL